MKKTILFTCIIMMFVCLFGCSSDKSEDKSNTATDQANYESIVSAANLAVADINVLKESGSGIEIKGSAEGWTIVGDAPNFEETMKTILGDNWTKDFKLKTNKSAKIEVSNGTVKRTEQPN